MMTWMTMQMWASGNHDDFPFDDAVHDEMERRRNEYADRFESIRLSLPPALVEADECLHDACLMAVRASSAEREVRLLVKPWSGPPEWWIFQRVVDHQWINHEIQLGGPPGFGHLGYSEIQLTAHGFQMAILCSSGLELVIHAAGFRSETAEHG